MAFFGTSRRVARRTARRTSRRWGAWNAMGSQAEEPEPQPQYVTQPPPPPQQEDPITTLKMRLAKGEITPEQYNQSVKLLQG
jgi:hypothetical protein